MTEHVSKAALVPIWEQHRNRILAYGYALHALLSEGDPPVTLHGRELRPDDEGVGFQFQYTLTDRLYNGMVKSACFVVQVELFKRKTSIGVKVDAAPILEYADGHYELFDRRGTSAHVGDKFALREYFAQTLTQSADHFFNRVRAGMPMDEIIAGITGSAPTT